MACRACKRELESVGISKERDFKLWAARGGHPDKGGDNVNFQHVSRCVDMVYKENCTEEAVGGHGYRGSTGATGGSMPRNGDDEVDAMASMLKFAVQALASCRIVGMNVESVATIGRAGGSTTRPFQTLKKTINVRLKHKRLFGIPFVPWHNLQVGATFLGNNVNDSGGFSGVNAGVSWRAFNNTIDLTLGGMLDVVTDHPQRPVLARYTAIMRWNCLSWLGKSDRVAYRVLSRMAVYGGYLGRCDQLSISESFRLHEEVVQASRPGFHVGVSVPLVYLGSPKPWVHVASSWGPAEAAKVRGDREKQMPPAPTVEGDPGLDVND